VQTGISRPKDSSCERLGQQLLVVALTAIVIALLAITWRMQQDIRRGAEIVGLLACGRGRPGGSGQLLERQSGRVDCPVCGAVRGNDCPRHGRAQRLPPAAVTRLTARRQQGDR
jgi:hypothetical protein